MIETNVRILWSAKFGFKEKPRFLFGFLEIIFKMEETEDAKKNINNILLAFPVLDLAHARHPLRLD